MCLNAYKAVQDLLWFQSLHKPLQSTVPLSCNLLFLRDDLSSGFAMMALGWVFITETNSWNSKKLSSDFSCFSNASYVRGHWLLVIIHEFTVEDQVKMPIYYVQVKRTLFCLVKKHWEHLLYKSQIIQGLMEKLQNLGCLRPNKNYFSFKARHWTEKAKLVHLQALTLKLPDSTIDRVGMLLITLWQVNISQSLFCVCTTGWLLLWNCSCF